jgi:hypothetical protein
LFGSGRPDLKINKVAPCRSVPSTPSCILRRPRYRLCTLRQLRLKRMHLIQSMLATSILTGPDVLEAPINSLGTRNKATQQRPRSRSLSIMSFPESCFLHLRYHLREPTHRFRKAR